MLQRSLMIVLMLMIFAGQVAAMSSQPCNMMMNAELPMSQMNHTNNQHEMHSMVPSFASQQLAQNSSVDCCDSDSGCFMGQCVSVGALALSIDSFMQPHFTAEKISLLSSLTENQFNSSLYRPPISH